jgi:hypothetical protein
MTIVTFYVSVWVPIMRSNSRSKILLYDREDFNKIIKTQPPSWDQFESGVVADFKFSLLLFELHMQELLEQVYRSSSQNNILADNLVKGQNYIKYAEVIRIYFCLDSPFCVTLHILIHSFLCRMIGWSLCKIN